MREIPVLHEQTGPGQTMVAIYSLLGCRAVCRGGNGQPGATRHREPHEQRQCWVWGCLPRIPQWESRLTCQVKELGWKFQSQHLPPLPGPEEG